jgi:excinuclease ABC subunit C
LVANIHDIDFIITKNANDALILEANLIDKHKPRFNVLLRDNNNYPYIILTDEKNPQLIYSRNYQKIHGDYFGPFADEEIKKYDIYKLLQRIFPLHKCHKVPKTKCLYYDMGLCLGPCINKIQPEVYKKIKTQIFDFFNGKHKQLINYIKNKENEESKKTNYEMAKQYLAIANSLKHIVENRVNVVLKKNEAVDIIGHYENKEYLSIVIHSYTQGKLLTVNKQIHELYDDVDETISSYLSQFYTNSQRVSNKIYMDRKIILPYDLKLNVPTKGKFKEIVNNANLNAKHFYETNLLLHLHHKNQTRDAFELLKATLKIDTLNLIHAFDMSNLFNDAKIGVMVALENGYFNKKLYRKFIIKDQKSNSDVQYMYEVIKRQYTRMLDEKVSFPNLIIVDGGIPQINAAKRALTELNLHNIIPIIGLSKNKQHVTEKIVIDELNKITLDKKSGLYSYLFSIQEEVHRFAINFNRKKREIK